MPLSSGLSIHDDTKHKGSAKRGVNDGLAGISAFGQVLNAAGQSSEIVNNKGSVNGYAALNGSAKIISRLNYENIANGVAGLDADAVIPHDSLRVGSHRAEHIRKVVSATLRHSHDALANITSGAWLKYKTITFTDGISDTLRIKHSSYCENSAVGSTFSRIYKNGVALGPICENSSDVSDVEFSQDINVGDLQPGDTLELWAYDAGYPDSRSVKNLRLYYDNEALIVAAASNS